MEKVEENEEEEVTTRIPYLNEEIILNILYNLPHETQLRFCSVSKSWRDMITNIGRPDSCYSIKLKSHHNLPTTPTLLGFFYPKIKQDATYMISWAPVLILEQQDNNPLPSLPESTLKLLNKPPNDYDDYMKLMAASNGYLLCQRFQRRDSSDDEVQVGLPSLHYYSVVNPLTQQRVDLPKLLKQFGCESVVGFDCLSNLHMTTTSSLTVVIVDVGSSFNHAYWDVKLFSSNQNQNQWSEFRLCMSYPPKGVSSVPSLATSPGVSLQKIHGNLLFFWFCRTNNFLIMLDQTKPCFNCIELPPHQGGFIDGYNYRALCAFDHRLFYGIQYQKRKIIQVFVYKYLHFRNFDVSAWELNYQVCLRELEDKCHHMMKSSSVSNDDDGDLLNSIVYKGFHPTNPDIIFLIFQGKLVSYDVKYQKLDVHTTVDETQHYSFVSPSPSDEINRHWIPCERWAWPRSFPCIH